MNGNLQNISGSIIFNICIKEEYGGFALASNFISKIHSGKELKMDEVDGITSLFWRDYKRNKKFETVSEIVRFRDKFLPIKKPELLNENIKHYHIIYCLWIEEAALTDIIDLQYDCLLKKYFTNEEILTILVGSKSLYHKASHYLYDLSCKHKDLYNTTYFMEAGQKSFMVQRLQINNIGSLTDFMPLYLFGRGETDLFSLLEDKILPEELLQMYESKQSDGVVSPAIQGCLALLKSSRVSIKEIPIKRMLEMLCSGNVFSFFIFCYSLSAFSKNRFEDFDSVKKYYFKVREYAAGCEQLIENVIHHSETGCGAVTIRFHEVYSKYIPKRYGDMLEKIPYLEILITDYAGINNSGNIADNFRLHLDNDYKEAFKNLQPTDFLIAGEDTKHREEIQNAFNEFYKKSVNIGRHMGLKVFKHIIENNNGTFTFYSHRGHNADEGENYKYREYKTKTSGIQCMPGTGYTVLFPLKKMLPAIMRNEVSIEKDVNLEENFGSYINGYHCEAENIDADSLEYNGQAEKEKMIYELSQKFLKKRFDSNDKSRIIYISAYGLKEESAEYIVKALLMAGRTEHIPDYVFYDCNKAFKVNFQNTMKVYFAMKELEYLFIKKEFVIAIYTEPPIDGCFIIPGNISKTMWANRKNSYMGEGWNTENWLYSDKPDIGMEEDCSDIPPYDILFEIDRDGTKGTIFEKYTLQVLDTDIQEKVFGCKISETHMRLGSTIHINNFYEAELLFSNRLFVSRFAYLLAKQIYMEKKVDEAQGITLYSYALYSETLIVELLNLMEKLYPNKDIDYAILEREAEHRDFKHIDRIRYSTPFKSEEEKKEHFQNRSIIIIVPINSTLKTHEKLISLFCENNAGISRDRFVSNFALVLVGSEDKNEYWEIDEDKKIVTNIKLDIVPAPHYFILVKVKYYEALGCELCFPKNPLDEIPLVEVNAASTIPNQSFGLYGEAINNNGMTYEEIRKEEEALSVLKDSLIYSHIRRGENHYLYYFKTDEIFLNNKSDIMQWLQKVRSRVYINREEYHVLFCPAHFSNAGFLECVNRVIFNGAALIIRVDVDKEFRSNILAKYSNLSIFANLLIENKINGAIKVYYVDDSIITGRTFNRAKSLMSSVVERYKHKENNIDIHIFEKIFLLIDRNSKESRLQYIGCWDSKNKTEEQLDDNYFVYRTLHISSMRNHGDSCTLCQLEREAKLLHRASATRQMSHYWKTQVDKFEIQSLMDKQDEQMVGNSLKIVPEENAFRRMFCSHIITLALEASRHGNKRENVINCFLKLLLEDYKERKKEFEQAVAFEYMLSYLKIISRPFHVFDKAMKETAFDIQLLLTEGLMNNNKTRTILSHVNKPYLKKSQSLFEKLIENIIRQDFSKKQRMDLFLLLMKQLTEMKSNYFIRINNIINIVNFAADYDEDARNKLYIQYLHQTKKLLGVSSDTSKSAWFNHELCKEENFQKLPEDILGNLILENTRAYFDGIEKMCRSLDLDYESVKFLCEERWYGAEFHQYSKFDEQIKGENPPSDIEISNFLEGSFRRGKESVPERDKVNLARSNPAEYFDGCLDKVTKLYDEQCKNRHITEIKEKLAGELKKAQYRDFRSVLTDMGYISQDKFDIDGAVALFAGMQLMNLCNEYKRQSAPKGEIEVVCFHIACLMEKILGAKSVKIILECPLKSEEWKDDIIKEYNSLLEKNLQSEEDKARLTLKLQNKKEYLEIADSGVRPDIIEEVEAEIANRLILYRRNQTVQDEGYVIDKKDNYLIWEMGEVGIRKKDERRLLIYAQFYDLNFPKDWQILRNLFCMNYLLNNSVFVMEDMDYLFELVLADKELLMYNMEKAHSHTAASVKTAQCDLVKLEEEEEGSFRSFVLTLLSDLQVSQVYRQSLKKAYYQQNVDIRALTCGKVLDILYKNMPLMIVNQNRVCENDIYVKICTKFPEEGLINEGECRLDKGEEILSYAYANSGNEVFLLLLALIMNAAGPQRADIETQEKFNSGMGTICVYLTKSENGCLRIANKCGQENIDVKQINEELEFQPRRNKGISLWSISRYIYGLISILLRKEIELFKSGINTADNVILLFEELKETISEALGDQFKVSVGVEKGYGGIKYFYMDIPILGEKYRNIFKSLK